MNTITREINNQKWAFIIATPLWLSVPLLDGMFNYLHQGVFRSDSGGSMLLTSLPIFAVILSAICNWQEFGDRRDKFICSRPINLTGLFAIRISVAAVLMFVMGVIVLLPDLFNPLMRDPARWPIESWTFFTFGLAFGVLLFAATSLLMAVTGDTSRSVIVVLWFGVMLIMWPFVTAAPLWLNPLAITHYRAYTNSPGLVGSLVLQLAGSDWGKNVSDSVSISRNAMLCLAWMYALAAVLTVAGAKLVASARRYLPDQKALMCMFAGTAVVIFVGINFHLANNFVPVTSIDGVELAKPTLIDSSFLDSDVRDMLGIEEDKRSYTPWHSGRLEVLDDASGCLYRAAWNLPSNTRDGSDSEFDAVNAACVLSCYLSPLDYARQNTSSDVYNEPADRIVLHFDQTFSHFSYDRHQRLEDMCVEGDYLYLLRVAPDPEDAPGNLVSHQDRHSVLHVVDISDTGNLRQVATLGLPGPEYSKMAIVGKYMYLLTYGQLGILSLENPAAPVLVENIERSASDNAAKLFAAQDKNYLPTRNVSCRGDRILLCDGQGNVVILSVADPLTPRVIYRFSHDLESSLAMRDSRYIEAALLGDSHYYLSCTAALIAVEFANEPDGQLRMVSEFQRKAAPLERFCNRRPRNLILRDNWLIENCGNFGLVLYDVSDPMHPQRRYHGETSYGYGHSYLWRDMIYSPGQSRLLLHPVPQPR